MLTFEEWWKGFVKDNMSCTNHRKDFKKAW